MSIPQLPRASEASLPRVSGAHSGKPVLDRGLERGSVGRGGVAHGAKGDQYERECQGAEGWKGKPVLDRGLERGSVGRGGVAHGTKGDQYRARC